MSSGKASAWALRGAGGTVSGEGGLNYYPFNVGDYAAHTMHLEPMEDLAYRRLLDQYYLREEPLPVDVNATAKLIRMRSMLADVQSVLDEFFVLTEEGWRHKRCDEEIAKMQDKQAKAKASARASVNARSANAQRTLNERSTSVEQENAQKLVVQQQEGQMLVGLSERSTDAQRTLPKTPTDAQRTLLVSPTDVELPTPTPTPNNKRKALAVRPDDVSQAVWDDFTRLRKEKRAPLTATALAGIAVEAKKAGLTLEKALERCCRQGWQGFDATWVPKVVRPAGRDPTDPDGLMRLAV